MNLSFAGCGFLGIYHIGVASCFREYAPHALVNKISGASVGSLAAAALICGVPLGQTTTDVLRVAVKARSRTLGPLHPSFDLNRIIREGLEKALPENAHKMCSGRLFISCTRLPDRENVLISQFNSREDLIQALLCSCFIPLYSGISVPKFDGAALVDGGLSDNLPVLDVNTITVSPFAGEHDICPQDENCNILQINIVNTSIAVCPGNMYRFSRILFPPPPEILSKMCQQGFDDALKYLQRHNLIACTRCMEVQSSLSLSDVCQVNNERVNKETHSYDNCIDCRYRRQAALLDSLPDSVVKAIQEACDQVNKGVINWLFKNRPMKLLSILGLPYTLSFDISILIFFKVWQKLPSLQKEIQSKYSGIIMLIKNLLHKIDTSRHHYSANFSCRLAIKEFDYTEENVTSSYAIPSSEKWPHDTCSLITEQEEKKPQLKAKSSLSLPDLPHRPDERLQRKSYAGFMNKNEEFVDKKNRRMSMVDVRQPERVIRNMKFGFTMDLQPSVQAITGKKQNISGAFHSLGEDEADLNVIDITNKALICQRECLGRYNSEEDKENGETLKKLLTATNNEAVMSYYYLDDDKTVKVTELYNMDDADTSFVSKEEEQEVSNRLQWENEWLSDPNIACNEDNICVTDTFEDKEFSMSDTECEKEQSDVLEELETKDAPSPLSEKIINTKPQRKKSFIIVK